MANQVAYGFHELQDIFARRVIDSGTDIVMDAILASTALYERDLDAMLSGWVTDWSGNPQTRVELPEAGELQPLSENGVPVVTRGGSSYTQALPLMRGGDAYGFNRESYAKANIGDFNRETLRMMKKDSAWNIRRLLAAVLTEASWTYEDEEFGDLTIKGLANGDTDKYLDLNGDLITDDHYLAQANPIADADNPFPTIYEELYEHPENSGAVVAMIPTNLKASITALSNFYQAQSLDALVDFGNDVSLANDMVEVYRSFGNRVLGVVDDVVIVESRRMPSNYMIAYSSGEGSFMRRRIPQEAELQGLQVVPYQVNSNFSRFDYYRIAGYAVWNRIGAVAMRIGNASYATPATHDASKMAG